MMKTFAFALLVFASACGVGEDGPDETLETIDPNPNKLICSSGFKTQGSFTAAQPRPIDNNGTPADTTDDFVTTGCWPVGTWTFTVAHDDAYTVLDITGDKVGDRCGEVAGTTKPTLLPTYVFSLDRLPDMEKDVITYQANLAGAKVARLSVTEGGGGECEASVEIFSADVKMMWNLHPALTETTITGFGEYTQFEEPQPYTN